MFSGPRPLCSAYIRIESITLSGSISVDTIILTLPSYLTLIVDRGRPEQLAFVKGLLYRRLDAGSHLGWPMCLCPR